MDCRNSNMLHSLHNTISTITVTVTSIANITFAVDMIQISIINTDIVFTNVDIMTSITTAIIVLINVAVTRTDMYY